jgi:hypothetical protein
MEMETVNWIAIGIAVISFCGSVIAFIITAGISWYNNAKTREETRKFHDELVDNSHELIFRKFDIEMKAKAIGDISINLGLKRQFCEPYFEYLKFLPDRQDNKDKLYLNNFLISIEERLGGYRPPFNSRIETNRTKKVENVEMVMSSYHNLIKTEGYDCNWYIVGNEELKCLYGIYDEVLKELLYLGLRSYLYEKEIAINEKFSSTYVPALDRNGSVYSLLSTIVSAKLRQVSAANIFSRDPKMNVQFIDYPNDILGALEKLIQEQIKHVQYSTTKE